MATVEELSDALRNADAAGDNDGARILADEIVKMRQPKGFVANATDFVKSIPRGIIGGLTSAPNPALGVPAWGELGDVAATQKAATETLKSQVPAPQGPVGKVGEAVGEGLGNPVSWMGPGGLGRALLDDRSGFDPYIEGAFRRGR